MAGLTEEDVLFDDATGEQAKRLASAREAACTPAAVDKAAQKAIFEGHWGKYETYPDFCTCPDFSRRQQPCKHIYRLCMELGLFNISFRSYTHGGYSWKKAIEVVEALPEDVQKEFCDHFRASCASPAPYRRKKTPELEALITNGLLVEYPERETAKFKEVRLIEDFMVDRQKVKTYFSRKFWPPTYMNGDGEMVPDDLPNDEITAFLHERGF